MKHMYFLAVFASSPSLAEFRRLELETVAEMLGVRIVILDDEIPWMAGAPEADCFCVFEAEDGPLLEQLAQRCVLLRGLYILFRSAPTLEALSEAPNVSAGEENKARVFCGEEQRAYSSGSYHYRVVTIGKRYTGEQKQSIVQSFVAQSRHDGVADCKAPERVFYLFLHHQYLPPAPGTKDGSPAAPMLRAFFCLERAESLRGALLLRYDLKRRPYIGTTSMPPEEALLMANLARVRRGDYVLDPFGGTGSLLVAAAHCGARTIAADADGQALREGSGRARASAQMRLQRELAFAFYTDEQLRALTPAEREAPSLVSNFKVYGLPLPDRLRFNFSTWERGWRRRRPNDAGGGHPSGKAGGKRESGLFDAIISDPPYGIREPQKKADEATSAAEAAEARPPHYETSEVAVDLALFAAEQLVLGGRLVFWHPTTDRYTPAELPTHPSLTLRCATPQRLSLKVVRRLVVMEKTAPLPTPAPTRAQCAPAAPAADDLRALVRQTTVPDNADYMQYRQRVERQREAARLFKCARMEPPQGEAQAHEKRGSSSGSEGRDGQGCAAGGERERRRNRNRRRSPGYQEQIVANRERKLRLREEKQARANERNAEIAQRAREERERQQQQQQEDGEKKE